MYVLYKCKIETDDDNIFTIMPDADSVARGAKSFSVKANAELLKRFLRRCGSADELTSPRSQRGLTYDAIVNNILNCTDNNLYIFGHRYPKSFDDLQNLMR